VQSPLFGMRYVEGFLRTRYADVAKAAFLLQSGRIRDRALMRKQPVFHAGKKHHWELQALRRMHGHELNTVFPGVRLPLAGFQGRVGQERVEDRHLFSWIHTESFGSADQFLQVFDLCIAALTFFF
jgi:hypothetical protein